MARRRAATDEALGSPTTDPAFDPQTGAPEAPPVSRSARKREALARQRLGVRLTHLTRTQLASLDLPEELLDAVLEAQRLRSRAALARQRQYIGRLMRQLDPAPIELALDAKLSQ